jgi:hypothetical protein
MKYYLQFTSDYILVFFLRETKPEMLNGKFWEWLFFLLKKNNQAEDPRVFQGLHLRAWTRAHPRSGSATRGKPPADKGVNLHRKAGSLLFDGNIASCMKEADLDQVSLLPLLPSPGLLSAVSRNHHFPLSLCLASEDLCSEIKGT